MRKVLVLGASGLIGHQVYFCYKARLDFEVYGIARHSKISEDIILLDARDERLLESTIREIKPDYIINCMGVLIEVAKANPEQAIFLNAYLPHRLQSVSSDINAKLVHISTDCVFSGKNGPYQENDIKDADDIYGRAKALGEIKDNPHVTLRTSVVGPELRKEGEELFHWFMNQGAFIKGFTKAIWSGVTTLELAKAIEWAVDNDIKGVYQVTNGAPIDKYSLLMLFKKYTGKNIEIEMIEGRVTNKSMTDTRQELNYTIPDYDTMIKNMVEFMRLRPSLYHHYKLDEPKEI